MAEYKERKAYKDGSYLLLIYKGTPKYDDADRKAEVERGLYLFMNNERIHDSIVRNASFIRTIFHDYDEEYMYLKYHSNDKDEYVEFVNGEMTLFERKANELDKINSKEKKMVVRHETSYSKGGTVKFGSCFSKQAFERVNSIVNRLKTVGPVVLDNDHQELIDAFMAFYNNTPNFSNPDINMYYQNMIAILKKFNIEILNFDDFEMIDGFPYSLKLEEMILDMTMFGLTRGIDDIITLDNGTKERIKEIGLNIKNKVTRSGVPMNNLILFTKTLYAGKKEFSKLKNNYNDDDIDDNVKLIKKLGGMK